MDKAVETILILLSIIASISAVTWFVGLRLIKGQNVTKKSVCSD